MRLKILCVLMLSSITVGGCAEWDVDAFMPATFTSDYAKIGNCAVSPTHGGMHVETYVQQERLADWKAGNVPFVKGTVFAKVGYDDSACADGPTKHWAMRKTDDELGKWEWQTLDGDGVCEEQGQLGACIGCHSASTYSDADWVAAKP